MLYLLDGTCYSRKSYPNLLHWEVARAGGFMLPRIGVFCSHTCVPDGMPTKHENLTLETLASRSVLRNKEEKTRGSTEGGINPVTLC